MELINKLKNFLKEYNADALLINSTNEFLVEYNQFEKNARYSVTGFSGSTGDVLLTSEKVFQFVDGRYHEQADLEVDTSIVDVVKLQMGQQYIKELATRLKNDSVLLVVGKKISSAFLNALNCELEQKNITFKILDFDPVFSLGQKKYKNEKQKLFLIDKNIAGETASEKLEKISSKLAENESIVVSALEDIAYLTNIRSYDIPYSSSFYAKMLIDKHTVKLYTDSNINLDENMSETFKILPLKNFDEDLKSIKNATVKIDEKTINTYDLYNIDESNNLQYSNISTLKTQKNDSELKHFKSSFERADNALMIISDMINSNKIYSETDYYDALVDSFYNNEAQSLSFKPIIAAGTNSSIIHYSHPKNNFFVNEGDFLLVDCGGYYEGGYATDITRTFLKGTPTDYQKIVYTTVLKAFFTAYKASYTTRNTWYDIDKKARDVINQANLAGFSFNHSTGHGVGLNVHETPPALAPSDLSKKQITHNAVFSIEPGIYKPLYGGVRLENTVYSSITNGKVSINTLSKFKFEPKLVDFSMLSDIEREYFEEWQAM
ncbi:MAG: M24 family metallopeptidase [Candidatus Gastranaerophilales bacterium]|nr:M24 family metallopeptidase [Candidatus Gastranaerophilales bacterium]